MSRSGKVNPVTVLLVLALIAGGYWLFIFLPFYLDNLDVREAVDMSIAYYRLDGPEAAHRRLFDRLNRVTTQGAVGYHYEIDEEGVEQKVPGLDIDEDNVTFDYDESTKWLTLRVSYDRVVDLVPFDKRRTIHFDVEKRSQIK